MCAWVQWSCAFKANACTWTSLLELMMGSSIRLTVSKKERAGGSLPLRWHWMDIFGLLQVASIGRRARGIEGAAAEKKKTVPGVFGQGKPDFFRCFCPAVTHSCSEFHYNVVNFTTKQGVTFGGYALARDRPPDRSRSFLGTPRDPPS